MTLIRLNKFLAERIGVSRREADELIKNGLVTIDGKIAKLGDRLDDSIDKNSKVCYNKKIIPLAAKYLYIALNKPVGYVCSRRSQGSSPTIYALLPKTFQNLKTVGRLDKDSSGLILLTNDGDFAFQMTHPKFHKEKTYEVELDKELEPLHQQMISDYGVLLEDGVSKFPVIRLEKSASRKQFTVVLTEGRNRQIRRTFAALGYAVVKLHRVSFGKYKLNELASGQYQVIKPII